jgi:predicted CXXCH cytochrome family protein
LTDHQEDTMRVHRFRLGFAALGLLFLLIAPATAWAQDPTPEPGTDECVGCHEGLREYWDDSAHGQAYSNPEFQAAWLNAGEDGDCLECHTTAYNPATETFAMEGVACTVCHNPIPARHPESYVPTNVSSRLCGDCHLDTYTEWEDSQHGAEDLNCSNCHNPHTTALRIADSQDLCLSCHEDEGHYFAFTAHAEEGLICTDCHLSVEDGPVGEGHGMREHTFKVDLETCNSCHEHDMHAAMEQMPAEALAEETVCYRADTLANLQAREDSDLAAEPGSMAPWQMVIPAGFALVFGMMLAPLVERWTGRRERGE